MRRLSLAMVGIAMAALMTMVSCRKPNIGNGNTVAPRTMTFNATTEMGTNKTSLDGLNVNWSAGDQLSINGESFTLSAGAGTTFASFTSDEEVSITAPYYAAYPASAATYNDGTLTFNLSAERTYDATEVKIPMAALNYSDMTTVYFKNVVNVLKLQLKGVDTDASKLTSIVLTSTTSSLNGHVAVTFSGDTPVVGAADGTNTTTLSFGDDGLQLASGETKYVYVVLPKITGGDLKIKFNCANGKFMRKTIDVSAYHEFGEVNNMFVVPELIVNATTSPAAAPSSVTTVAGCSGFIYSMGGTVTLPSGAAQEVEYGFVCTDESDRTPEIGAPNCFKVVGGVADMPAGTNNFNVDITGLTTGVDYRVRAYAIGENGTVVYASSSDGIKTVTGGDGPKAVGWDDGTSPYEFTVGPNTSDRVHFSQGNLQYVATGTHAVATGGTATGTWRFAKYQFEFLGTTTGQDSADEDKTRDLFGWGTSGYNSKYPYMTIKEYFFYGAGENNIVGTYYDWGLYNDISGDGELVAGAWRILTNAEWTYLFNGRSNASNLYGEGMVSCTPGVIILPDNWNWDASELEGMRKPTGVGDLKFTVGGSSWLNTYSYTKWSVMESLGAVFLPASGRRDGITIYDVGNTGFYWSSTCRETLYAYAINIYNGGVYAPNYNYRYYGWSVRLVR